MQKSLYRLKQASRKWFSKLSKALLSCAYSQSKSDYSLFVRNNNASFTVILAYIDDVILAGNDSSKMSRIKHFLDNSFKIKDLEDLKFFLGLEIARCKIDISICQRKYASGILPDTDYLASKLASIIMDSHLKLGNETSTPLSLKDVASYRETVGRLKYLNTTRLNIAFAIQQLSQFLSKPTDIHQNALHRLLRYIKLTLVKNFSLPHLLLCI